MLFPNPLNELYEQFLVFLVQPFLNKHLLNIYYYITHNTSRDLKENNHDLLDAFSRWAQHTACEINDEMLAGRRYQRHTQINHNAHRQGDHLVGA